MTPEQKNTIIAHCFAVMEGKKDGYTGMTYEQGIIDMMDIIDDDMEVDPEFLEGFE